MKLVANLLVFLSKIWRRMKMLLIRPAFKSYGKNLKFDPDGNYSFKNIEVGDDVFFGIGACLLSISKITIGNKVMFGPQVKILGGDHNTSVIGKYMFDITDKLPENDLPIVIEDDVWIGAGAYIMKGVTIGKGSIIAAGSIVTKDVDPYSIYMGIPAKKVKSRFNKEDLEKHIKLLDERK